MSSLNELLNLLNSPPAGSAGLSGGSGSVVPKNPQNGGETFDQVLSRLASQTQAGSNAATPKIQSGETGNGSASAQTRQALGALTTGLNQLVGLLSKVQQGEGSQTKVALQTLGGGAVTPEDIQNTLNDLQLALQKLSPSQNPLNLPPGEQASLLAQVIQQMVAQGQIQLGGGGTQPIGNNATVQAAGAAQGQTTQVSINLPNFKMTATFIQEGAGGPAGTPLNQPISAAPAVANGAVSQTNAGSAANLSATGNDLGQNFKNLVQLLMQSGVGQAALTTLIRNAGESQAATAGSQAQVPASTGLTQPLPPVELPPPSPAEAALGAFNNADAARPQGGGAAGPTENQQVQNPLNPPALPAVETPAPSAGGNLAQTAPQSLVNPTTLTPVVEPPENNTLSPITAPGQTLTAQNQAPRSGGQAQETANPALLENPALNPQEVAALNDVVTRLNTAALHQIQGSIGGAGSILSPSSNLTMGQVLSSLSATRLSNAEPPTFGNPSVPMNAPPPPQLTLAAENNIQAQREAALAPTLQPVAPNNTAPASRVPQPQSVAFSTSPITFSSALQEPMNQTIPPTVPPAGNTPLVAPVSVNNSGLAGAVLGATNNPVVTAIPTAVAPPTTANVVAGPTPTTTPETIVALPQPSTLPTPAGANPPAVAPANTPGTAEAFAPASLNQAVVPPAASSAPNVPATTSMGEAVKTEAPPAAVVRNENLNFQTAGAAAQPASSVLPISPEAVAPSGTVLASAADLTASNATDKNGPNHSAVLEGNILLNLSNSANIAPDNSHATTSASVATSAPGGNFDTVSLLNQISQQVAAQTAEAKTVSRLNFQLIPESLGRVTVQLALVDQAVSARIVVTSPEVRDTLQGHMVDLKAALNQAGLQIDQLQVQVQGGGSNLLAQYYQYQQEGFGYRLPVSPVPAEEGPENPVNAGVSAPAAARGLVDVLA